MKDYFDGILIFDLDDLFNKVLKLLKDWFDLEFLEKYLIFEQCEELKKVGLLEEFMKMLEECLCEQYKKYQGGNKMIGIGGTFLFGVYGDYFEGVCIGGLGCKCFVVKVWE